MTQLNVITGIVVGQYGEAIQLQVVDDMGVGVDISAYSTLTVTLRYPQTSKILSYAASFVSGGTDGKIQFTPLSGDIDTFGDWEGQVEMEGATSAAFTRTFEVQVGKRISAST